MLRLGLMVRQALALELALELREPDKEAAEVEELLLLPLGLRAPELLLLPRGEMELLLEMLVLAVPVLLTHALGLSCELWEALRERLEELLAALLALLDRDALEEVQPLEVAAGELEPDREVLKEPLLLPEPLLQLLAKAEAVMQPEREGVLELLCS